MTHLHSIPGTANIHCQQVESNYMKLGALFNRRSQTGGDMVAFPFLCSRQKSKEARTCKLFPPQCVRAHTHYLPGDIPGLGVEGMGIWQDPAG